MNAPPVQYVTTSDGYSIAYTVCGQGQPLVLLPTPFSNVNIYWREESFLLPWLKGLAERFQLVYYDARGQGMSTRGLKESHSLDDDVSDLEAVVKYLNLDRPVLISSTHIGIRYAIAHPEHTEALILTRVPASGAVFSSAWRIGLAQENWSLFLRTVAGPTSPSDLSKAVQRLEQSTTQADHLIRSRVLLESDVTDLLPKLKVPTLVLPPRNPAWVGVEQYVNLATRIPGARIVVTDGDGPLGDHVEGLKAIEGFLADLPPLDDRPSASASSESQPDGLSDREVEVLRLLAQGKSNPEIAKELFITRNTVQNHVSSILIKTNLNNRAQAAIYAERHNIT